ncbi:large ribosomal subunit protein mL62 [Scleropages formosus]|uniref:Large ribosomal subunit protein mL62 n=2 Tax=Scleropages formosus TaxID=113540 RepID=A0A8C9QZD0_SCLFO|nr:peptidyl-tRNA hydrolase ICT1, mitochondrial [Scleropages formosus]
MAAALVKAARPVFACARRNAFPSLSACFTTHGGGVSRFKRLVCLSFKYSSKAEDCKRGGQICIPMGRLSVTYSRSSGAGGQHVNKVNTKVEVRFHVQTADWIPEEVRNKILSQNENRINKAGELMVTSEASRSQQRNLSDCLQKISDIIAEASRRPREPTAEDLALRKSRLEYWNKERLKQKKIHSALKQSRKVDFD